MVRFFSFFTNYARYDLPVQNSFCLFSLKVAKLAFFLTFWAVYSLIKRENGISRHTKSIFRKNDFRWNSEIRISSHFFGSVQLNQAKKRYFNAYQISFLKKMLSNEIAKLAFRLTFWAVYSLIKRMKRLCLIERPHTIKKENWFVSVCVCMSPPFGGLNNDTSLDAVFLLQEESRHDD